MSRIYFFRNDDVRDTLDDSLVELQRIFMDRGVPIIHAVEPANLTGEVVDWLLDMRREHPDLVQIMQHGYDHTIKNRRKKGEFGGQRGFEEQYEDIRRGKELMNEHFGDQWFEAFNFPYAPYNPEAIRALQQVGYKVLNSHYNREWKRRALYFIGRLLGKGMLLGKHVSWNMRTYPGTSIMEISMNITFIKRYFDERTDCEFFTQRELCDKIDSYLKSRFPVGLLLHHRYHTRPEHFMLVEDVLDHLERRRCVPSSMPEIYETADRLL